MSDILLVIGNKNYSSWSMRAWLALKHTGVDFEELVIPLYQIGSKEEILKYSPSGKVPALRHGEMTVWDSLAICEYLAETFPDAQLWPEDRRARMIARAISAEMHSSFQALRENLPMNLRAPVSDLPLAPEVQNDINRVAAIWRRSRRHFGNDGDFLFSQFSIADVMFAPVVARFRTYGIAPDENASAYMDAVWASPMVQEFATAARNEPWIVPEFEH
jgi:glutathione S-transferase